MEVSKLIWTPHNTYHTFFWQFKDQQKNRFFLHFFPFLINNFFKIPPFGRKMFAMTEEKVSKNKNITRKNDSFNQYPDPSDSASGAFSMNSTQSHCNRIEKVLQMCLRGSCMLIAPAIYEKKYPFLLPKISNIQKKRMQTTHKRVFFSLSSIS